MYGFNRCLKLFRRLHDIHAVAPDDRTIRERIIFAVDSRRFDRMVNDRFGGAIGIGAEIGDDVVFPHMFHGLFIASGVKIGRGSMIMHHVTIGAGGRDGNWTDLPALGENVFIGANATIIGRCIIGDGAKIGAGVTLVDAVIPAGATIINKSAFNLTEGKPVYPG